MKIRLLQKITVAISITLMSTALRAASFEEYRPTWEIGQTWTVEVSVKTQAKKLAIRNPPPFVAQWGILTYGFVVEKIVEIEGDPCWCIRIDYLKSDKQSLSSRLVNRVYYRISDCTLKRAERIKNTGNTLGDTYSGGSAIVGEWTRPMPMEFPYFHADSGKHSPKPYKIWKDGTKHYKSYEAYQTACIIEKKVQGEKKKVLSVYIKEKNEVKKQEGLAALQLWEKGMPWWSEATETENGIFRCKARLISIDGKKLENPCPWNLGPANASEEGKKDDE